MRLHLANRTTVFTATSMTELLRMCHAARQACFPDEMMALLREHFQDAARIAGVKSIVSAFNASNSIHVLCETHCRKYIEALIKSDQSIKTNQSHGIQCRSVFGSKPSRPSSNVSKHVETCENHPRVVRVVRSCKSKKSQIGHSLLSLLSLLPFW